MNEVSASGRNMFAKSTLKFLSENVEGCAALDISTNHVDEAGAKFLAEHLRSRSCQLQALCLVQCHMSFRASCTLFAAIGVSKLVEVYLDENILNDECCKALAIALSSNPPLQMLSLVGCNIDSDGAIYLFPGLCKCESLRHLRMDSNQILDRGLAQIGSYMHFSHIETLGLSDNRIWKDGTTALISACQMSDRLRSLDIGFNIVDLDVLGAYVLASTRLERLCVSGCKVVESKLNDFLEKVGRSKLVCLMIDGLNFQALPVGWGYKVDTVWQVKSHLPNLIATIKANPRLNDVRIGFLDLDAVLFVKDELQSLQDRQVTISVHDFGHVGNVWVIEVPEFRLLSPTRDWKWAHRFTVVTSVLMGQVFALAECDGQPMQSIDLSNGKLTDETLSKVMHSVPPCHLSLLDLSNNDLKWQALEIVCNFLEKDGASIDVLNLSKAKVTERSLERLFAHMSQNPTTCPIKLWLCFEGKDNEQLGFHNFTNELGAAIAKNCRLEELHLKGNISVIDVKKIISGISKNKHLRTLDLDSTFFSLYDSPDPELDDGIQAAFDSLIDELHTALTSKSSVCVMRTFNFALLTEVFLYNSPNLSKWPEIVSRLERNEP